MTISRRSFFSGLAVALAAPAIVKAEGLMRLAPTEILRPDISLRLITEYNFLEMPVNRLDVLYSYTQVRPEWTVTLDEYSERILALMIEQMQKKIADAIMYGSGVTEHYHGLVHNIRPSELFVGAKSTPSIE